MKSWAELIDAAKADKKLDKMQAQFLEQAGKAADLEVIRRVYKLEDVGKHRTWLDHRGDPLEPEIAQAFALAMSDFSACGTLSNELPLLAAAYRLTGDAKFKDRVLAQLDEMASWSPLQRPGWTCYEPGRKLPPDGKDGNWLATGCGIRAIADTLEILPEGTVSPELRGRLNTLLSAEIDSIVDDWKTKRSWFIRADNPITNQWVLPTEGLVRACLLLGKDDHKEVYELGVRNLLRALDAHGPAGEFEEGIGYAEFTVTSMLSAARAMARAGDRRAIDRPFLRKYPTWAVHHLQPGGMIINCFDAGATARGDTGRMRPPLSVCAVYTGSEVARWALKRVGGCSLSVPVFLAYALPPVSDGAAPPLFASYKHAARVNWRDSWEENASGVWIRGGHESDQHDHCDRGHVNYIYRGKPILIECGTPPYHMKSLGLCQSCAGHNVLQIGSQPAHTRPAPIIAQRLDKSGGHVTVDGTKCYDGVEGWLRDVQWSAESVVVEDEVRTVDGKQDVVTFRWNLGTDDEVSIKTEGYTSEVIWSDATILLEASGPISVTQEKMPDYTLKHREWDDDLRENTQTCIVVRRSGKVGDFRLRTRVVGR